MPEYLHIIDFGSLNAKSITLKILDRDTFHKNNQNMF